MLFFFKKNIFVVTLLVLLLSVSINLVKIPNTCKNMVNIEAKPKRGRIPNALKALKKQ